MRCGTAPASAAFEGWQSLRRPSQGWRTSRQENAYPCPFLLRILSPVAVLLTRTAREIKVSQRTRCWRKADSSPRSPKFERSASPLRIWLPLSSSPLGVPFLIRAAIRVRLPWHSTECKAGLHYVTGSAGLAGSRWVAGMKGIFIGIAAAIAVICPVCAQVPGTPQPQWPPTTYPDPYSYRFVAPTPDDAYRRGLINRWQLEQLEGPLPQALRGPSPNGTRGGGPGGS